MERKPKNFRDIIQRWLDENGNCWNWLAERCVDGDSFQWEDVDYQLATGETRTKTRRVAITSSKKPIGMTKSSMFRYLRGERDIASNRIWEIMDVIGFDTMCSAIFARQHSEQWGDFD